MGYTIKLVDEHGDIVQVDSHTEGVNRMVATTNAVVSMPLYKNLYNAIDGSEGIRWLYGKKALVCIGRLHGAIRELGMVQDYDYWKATPGNAGYALSILLKWAKQHPDAVFGGD